MRPVTAVVARAEAHLQREASDTAQRSHQAELARARHRARWAVLVAVALALVLILAVTR